jgi:hypothetical protein
MVSVRDLLFHYYSDDMGAYSSFVMIIVPYPFLTESNFPGRVGIYTGAVFMAFGAFRLINRLHN